MFILLLSIPLWSITIPVLVADTATLVAVAEDIGIDIDIVAWSIRLVVVLSMLIELDPISILLSAALARCSGRGCTEIESGLDCVWNCNSAKKKNGWRGH